jgi:hypothetical protein
MNPRSMATTITEGDCRVPYVPVTVADVVAAGCTPIPAFTIPLSIAFPIPSSAADAPMQVNPQNPAFPGERMFPRSREAATPDPLSATMGMMCLSEQQQKGSAGDFTECLGRNCG